MPSIETLDATMRDASHFVPAIRRIGGGALAIDGAGGLWRIAGRSTVIYALRRPDGRIFALRVPLADGEAANRYAERYLAAADAPALAPLRRPGGSLPAEIHVVPDGITIDDPSHRSQGHPVIATEYLGGGTLGQAARAAAEDHDTDTLGFLRDALISMLAANEAAGFDHGALGPETILLREDGTLATPNLLTAAWPGATFPAGAAPRPGRDRLPALVLLTALAALADNPALLLPEADWQYLLLTPEDLANPARSATFRQLIEYGAAPVARLAELAQGAHRTSSPPSIAETLAATRLTAPRIGLPTLSPAPGEDRPVYPEWVSPPPKSTASAWDHPAHIESPERSSSRHGEMNRLNALLLAGDYDGAARLWRDSGLSHDPAIAAEFDIRTRELLDRRSHPSAPGAVPAARPAPRLDNPDALRDALDAGDAERVAGLWQQEKFHPGSALLAHRVDALLTRDLTTRAAIAARRHDAVALSAIESEARTLGIALSPETRRAIRETRRATVARDDLAAAARVNDHAAIAQLVRSGALDTGQPLPPNLARTRDRALAWEALERALASGDDEAIVDAWDPSLLDADPALTQERRIRIERAEHRVWWLQSARAALRGRDSAAARRLLREIPSGIEARLSAVERRRLDRLGRAGAAVTRLEIALQTGP
ncbi:MAG: hypothetical protein ACR2J8_04130, partial [Thermomicrobiales bacterium]